MYRKREVLRYKPYTEHENVSGRYLDKFILKSEWHRADKGVGFLRKHVSIEGPSRHNVLRTIPLNGDRFADGGLIAPYFPTQARINIFQTFSNFRETEKHSRGDVPKVFAGGKPRPL